MNGPTIVNIHKVKGVRPAFDIYIGRATNHTEFTKNSIWHNPFTLKEFGERCLPMYEHYMRAILDLAWPQNKDKYFDFKVAERDAIDRAFRRVVSQKANHDAPGCGAFKLDDLTNKVLGCWCKPGPCHGDVLIKLWKEKHHG